MKRGTSPRERAKLRRRVRIGLWLLALGIVLAASGPAWAWWALNHSGRLALRQTINAHDVARGFEFGPVYLEEGVAGRYFLTATLPKVDGDYWHTSFEVLDDQHVPVYRQDELRIIGNHDFTTGERERYVKRFKLDKETGYYWFQFRSINGQYSADPAAAPVLEFSIRQHVITGALLWGPALSLSGLGLMLLGGAIWWLRRLARRRQQVRSGPELVADGVNAAEHPLARRYHAQQRLKRTSGGQQK
jgi:hypothetical protein